MTRCKAYYALKIIFVTFFLLILSNNLKSDDKKDLEEIIKKIEVINNDLKTLETAFYKTSEIKPSSSSDLKSIEAAIDYIRKLIKSKRF